MVDITLINVFIPIFVFLFVFVLMYSFLTKTTWLGKNNGIVALTSFVFAIMVVISPGALGLIKFFAPWFFMLVFVAFFIVFMLMIFGLKPEELKAGTDKQLRTWIIIFVIVALIFGLGNVFGQRSLEATGNGEEQVAQPVTQTETGTNQQQDPAQGIIQTTGIGNQGTTGESSLTGTDDFGTNVVNTLVNPKVLGMFALFIIAMLAAYLLSGSSINP